MRASEQVFDDDLRLVDVSARDQGLDVGRP
jgi:hypothetical protein